MNELVDTLRSEFQDKEYRHAYADECLNAVIAAQIKVLREQRGMTQKQLADATGMGQPRIPLLEDASYENWTVNTLKRFAKAFDVALSVKFEPFSSVMQDFENMTRESLQRPDFANDPAFHSKRVPSRRGHRRRYMRSRRGKVVQFRRLSTVWPQTFIAASTDAETNQSGARKKEPGREALAGNPIAAGGQAGIGG